jgi:putative peptide zinc metalloprotease protein
MLPGKWQRAAVGAAGIVVELVLAAAATFLWWFSEPGLFNSLCLNVMFVCSVSTLLINGNPLLRYDGYYVLADLTETPNLSRQATVALREILAHTILGIELPPEEELSLRRRLVLPLYVAASIVYRVFVLFGVLWFIHRSLQPHRLEALAEILAVAVVAGFIVTPLWQFGRFLGHPYWRRKVQTRRAALSGLAIVILAGATLGVPLPHRIAAPVVVQPADARRVYAAVRGTLVQGAEEGVAVRRGDTVAQLVNAELQLEIEQLRGQRDRQKLRVENLASRQIQDNVAAAELPTARELLADLDQRLAQKLLDDARLTLTAPVDGTVLPPRRHESQPVAGTLPDWSGTPLDPRNRGCSLETGTLVCLIGDPSRLEALLVIDQSDVEFVAPGQKVRIQLDQAPGTILEGTIEEVAEIDLKTTPPELLAAGDLASRKDAAGVPRPASTSYHARAALSSAPQPLLIGESGRAKIDVAPLSLGRRLMRALGRTFGVDLVSR